MSNNRRTQALDVLGDLLEDTAEEARLEQERLAAQLREREEAAKAAAEAERLEREAKAQAAIAAEEARRIEAAQTRATVDEALAAIDKEPEEAAPAAVIVAEAPKKSSLGPILAVAAVAILAVGGVFGWQTLSKPVLDNETLYVPVAVSPPATNAANKAEQQIAVLNRPTAQEEAPAAASRPAAARRPSSSRSNSSGGLNLGGSSLRR